MKEKLFSLIARATVESGMSGAAILRGLALFLGCFGMLNLLGGFVYPGFDLNLWWIDLRILPDVVTYCVLACGSLALMWFGLRPPVSVRGRAAVATAILPLFVAAIWNSCVFYALLAQGQLRTHVPLPLSLLMLLGLGLVLRQLFQSPQPLVPVPVRARAWTFISFMSCLIIFPLAQMFLFGKTNYARPADVAVVFGARTYADGRPSDALKDRVNTACRLYHDGMARKLIFSGGPGDGGTHETEAMRALALQNGVNPRDILLDRAGLNTEATVHDTVPMFEKLHARRVLVVSHYYHLPRVKMAYHQAGVEVYTVPAREPRVLRAAPYFLAREVVAVWAYYFHPLTSQARAGWVREAGA